MSARNIGDIAQRGGNITKPKKAGSLHSYRVHIITPKRVRAYVNSLLARLARAQYEGAGAFRWRTRLVGSDTLAAWEEAMGQLCMPCAVVKKAEGVWIAASEIPWAVLKDAVLPKTTAETVAVFPVEAKPD